MDLFKINEIRKHQFIQVPKELFHNPRYKGLSSDSKLLYGLLLDRMELSRENNWVNEKGEIYLIFTRENIQALLNISDKPCTKSFKQLKMMELIKEDRQGLGKPNLIFIGHIVYDTPRGVENPMNRKMSDSAIVKNSIQQSVNIRANNTNLNNTNLNNTYIPKEEEAFGTFNKRNLITKEEITATTMTDIDELVGLYNDNIGTVTKLVNDELKALLVNSSYELIYKAFKRGIDNNSCKLSYIKALLVNWNMENITTVAAVEDKFNKHKIKTNKINEIKEKNKENLAANKTIYNNNRKSKGIFDSAEQRPYTDIELNDIEDKLLGKYQTGHIKKI